jgi:Tfp pilus assembly protein FimT
MAEVNLNKKEEGFSLVELTILLALTAVVAAFSIPMLTSGMRSMQLASDARSIATTMTYAKLTASSQLDRYRLTFDFSNNRWRLGKYNQSEDDYDLLQESAISSGIANSGIQLLSASRDGSHPGDFASTSSDTITFSSRGTPVASDGPGAISGIVYLSDGNNDYAVSASISGKVQVWRLVNSQWITQ